MAKAPETTLIGVTDQIKEMVEKFKLPGVDAKALVDKVNRADLWREATKTLSVAAGDIPASDSRGPETFFNGKVFDPENPQAYLTSLAVKRIA